MASFFCQSLWGIESQKKCLTKGVQICIDQGGTDLYFNAWSQTSL